MRHPDPPRHVLLVEDDREMRVMLARHLRRHGYDVTEARDGVSALTSLGNTTWAYGTCYYDLLISDVRMPGHTGLDLLSELRRSDWALPVLLITAFGTAETHDEAKRLGAEILDKPLDLDTLTATVSRLLS